MNEATTKPSVSAGRVYFVLILTTIFWGGSFLFNKLGLREVPPAHFVLIRFTLASLVMLAVCARRLRGLSTVIVRKGIIVGLALGLTNLSFVFGVSGTSISRAGVLNNLFVLFIPLICAVVWRERIGRINFAGVALAAAGIFLLASGGGGFNRGDLFSTICAGFIAVHIIAVSKVLSDEDVYLISLVQFLTVAGLAGLTALSFPSAPYHIGKMGWTAIIYCTLLPTVVCFTLQNAYQRYTTPTRAGLIYTLDPVWSLLAGVIVLGERLSPIEWLGCGLIFLAALLPLLLRFAMEKRLIERYVSGN